MHSQFWGYGSNYMITQNTNYVGPCEVDHDVVQCDNCGKEDYIDNMVQCIDHDNHEVFYFCPDCYLNPKV